MNPEPLSTMVQGSVFRMFHSFDVNEPEKHRFFIVLSKNPQTDPLIFLVTVTTNIESQDRRYQNEVKKPLVWIRPSEFQDFHHFSVINCRSIHSFSADDLCERMKKRGGFVMHNNLPAGKLREILNIVAHDKTIVPSVARAII